MARAAGVHALAQWRNNVQSWEKAPGQPVSNVDLEIDAMLKTQLAVLDPEAAWLSEESLDDPARLQASRLWVVDPIDGTRDYINNRPGWAVSIAYVVNGQAIFGVLDAPARHEQWVATANGVTHRNGKPVQCSDRTILAGARVPADLLNAVDIDLVAVRKPNSIALRMAMVAAGEADLLASLRWGYEWDIAAGALIAARAGATVTDALGQPLRFNSQAGEAFGVLVTAPGIHTAALARLEARAKIAFETR